MTHVFDVEIAETRLVTVTKRFTLVARDRAHALQQAELGLAYAWRQIAGVGQVGAVVTDAAVEDAAALEQQHEGAQAALELGVDQILDARGYCGRG